MAPEVIDVIMDAEARYYANASSSHVLGREAATELEKARRLLSEYLDADDYHLIFTSGGTESDNLALAGIIGMQAKRRGVMLSSVTEHQAVSHCLAALAGPGRNHHELGVDSNGLVCLKSVEAALRKPTLILSVHAVNNETGVVQPVEEITKLARRKSVISHTDAVQALGKVTFSARKLGADLISLSGHKIHGPKGVGLLLVRKGINLSPIMLGGGQERGKRSGTVNLPAIIGLTKAVELLGSGNKLNVISSMRDSLEKNILTRLPHAVVNGAGASRCAAITNILIPFVNDNYLHARLANSALCVSSGSACASHKQEPSRVLLAMGLSNHDARASLRFSLSRFTTKADLRAAADILFEAVDPFI